MTQPGFEPWSPSLRADTLWCRTKQMQDMCIKSAVNRKLFKRARFVQSGLSNAECLMLTFNIIEVVMYLSFNKHLNMC